MGAMITIKYDGNAVTDEEANMLTEAAHQIVLKAIGEKDVFVYADKSPITAATEPIEVFVQVNKHKTEDASGLTKAIARGFSEWKKQNAFGWPINLNVIPVEWHSEVGI